MVKEIAERGQLALEESTLTVDASLPSSRVARLYASAAGVQVKGGASSRVRASDCGYTFSHGAAETLAQGALVALEHIRTTVSGRP
jgi:hypothetical protein